MSKINIGVDFNDDPSGRYYTDGAGSGEEFREEVLVPELRKLNAGQKIDIVIDDQVEGYGSSFLVEAFAGVIKYGYFEKKFLLDSVNIIYSDPDFAFYKDKIEEYIEQAKFNSDKYISTKIKG